MKITSIIIICCLLLNSCSKVRKSAGVTRKSIDEYQVIENPPLVIPPEFNLIPPKQLSGKNIKDIDNELAKDILFGLQENESKDILTKNTLDKILLEANANNISSSIRDEVDKGFAKEINTKDLTLDNWQDEIQILDALKESECIRNKNFEGKNLSECETAIKIEKVKQKKKKKFLFF